MIKATESKQPGQDLASLNTKTLYSYSKTTMKKLTQSPEATTAKQTSSVKQLNPATCTEPSAVQQPSYSTMTSSQTLTDKTSCTTTKQLSSKPVKQVSTYHITELIHLTKAIASMDLRTDPDFENESIDECLSRCLTLPAGQNFGPLPNGIIVQ